MIKIGQKEFKNEAELCKFLANLVHEGEEKMQKGEISSLLYEDMIGAWDDLVEKAHYEGWLSDKPHKVICDTLREVGCKPYPLASLELAKKEYDAFGLHGLSTDVSAMEG